MAIEKMESVKKFTIVREKWGGRKLRTSTGTKLCSLAFWLAECGHRVPLIPTEDEMTIDLQWFNEPPAFLEDYEWQEKITEAAVQKDETRTIQLFAEKGLEVAFS